MKSPHKTVRGPWVVAGVFAIVAAAGGAILYIVLNNPPPPAQPAPPGASLVPRVIQAPADAGPANLDEAPETD